MKSIKDHKAEVRLKHPYLSAELIHEIATLRYENERLLDKLKNIREVIQELT